MGEISPIAHVIQLSVAPVFLLSGIGAILAVMTSRLGRIASVPVALLFIAAMLAFFTGLLWFLREIFVATGSLRIASRRVHGRRP